MERDGCLYPFDYKFIKRAPHFHNRLCSVFSVYDQLGYKGVIVRRHDISVVDRGVYSDTRTTGKGKKGDLAG